MEYTQPRDNVTSVQFHTWKGSSIYRMAQPIREQGGKRLRVPATNLMTPMVKGEKTLVQNSKYMYICISRWDTAQLVACLYSALALGLWDWGIGGQM